jgi:cytochrome c oxidase subunit 2
MSQLHPEMYERWILRTELLWAFGVGIFIAAALSMILFTALTMAVNPPSNVERIDPKTLHLSGEFAEHNLGTTVGSDGSVTVRAVQPNSCSCPTASPCQRTARHAAVCVPDVIHGL